MVEFVLSSLVILGVMVGWLYVQEVYRRFAQRHPQLGPFRSDGGCEGACSCQQGNCPVPPSTGEHPILTVDLMKPVDDPARLRSERL